MYTKVLAIFLDLVVWVAALVIASIVGFIEYHRQKGEPSEEEGEDN